MDPSGPLPDRYLQSNFEAVNALKLGIEKSGYQGREDSPKLVAALEGLTMTEGPDFPTGDKVLRKEDHQAFMRELVFVVKDGTYHVEEVVPWQRTVVPPACRFAAA
jgi:branched-chain amino acid transport system substrate-binding protein